MQLKPHGLQALDMYKVQLYTEGTKQWGKDDQFSSAWISTVLSAEIIAIKISTPVDT